MTPFPLSREARMLAVLAVLAGASLLAGCAGGDPCATPAGQRGFVDGLGAMVSGSGERCVQQRQAAAAAAEQRASAAATSAGAAQAEERRTGAQVSAAEQRLRALNVQIAAQRGTVTRLRRERGAAATAGVQGQADALERERAAAARRPGGPSAADVQLLEQRSRELDEALGRFGAI